MDTFHRSNNTTFTYWRVTINSRLPVIKTPTENMTKSNSQLMTWVCSLSEMSGR